MGPTAVECVRKLQQCVSGAALAGAAALPCYRGVSCDLCEAMHLEYIQYGEGWLSHVKAILFSFSSSDNGVA